MALIHNATFDSQTRVLSLLDKAGNVISSCEVPSKELVDDIAKPLTFKATQNGSRVKLYREGSPVGRFQTSSDGGNTWADYTINTYIYLNIGDEVSFRAKSNRTSAQSNSDYFYFRMSGKIEAWHNVMSLYRTNDFATDKYTADYAFFNLFNDCPSLTKAPVLPAATLGKCCYMFTFFKCSNLKEVRVSATTKAPDALTHWLDGVAATGDFYCDPNATIFPTDSTSGIPKGWRRLNINDYPTT